MQGGGGLSGVTRGPGGGGGGFQRVSVNDHIEPVNSETIVTVKAYHCYCLNAFKSELDGHLLWILGLDSAPVCWVLLVVGVVWSRSDPDLNPLTAVTDIPNSSGIESRTG